MAARRASSALSVPEKGALYVALVAGLIAIWNDSRDAYREWTSRPEVTASSTTPLRIKYEPGTRTFTFIFGLVLHNEGTKAETIQDARAYFAVAHDPKQRFEFSKTDISMKEGTAIMPINLPIGRDVTKSVVCEVSTVFTQDLHAVLKQEDTRRVFELLLTGVKKDVYSVRFRFDVGKGVLAYVLDPSATTARTVKLIGSDLNDGHDTK